MVNRFYINRWDGDPISVDILMWDLNHEPYYLISKIFYSDITEEEKQEVITGFRINIKYDLIPRKTNQFWYKEKDYISPDKIIRRKDDIIELIGGNGCFISKDTRCLSIRENLKQEAIIHLLNGDLVILYIDKYKYVEKIVNNNSLHTPSQRIKIIN